ncbi:MAG TPA: hypothetical protein VF077_12765 [Nitrospiraceae bacterium]
MKHEIKPALIFAALICAPFAAILFCLMLASCSPSTSPAAPAFLGKWADDSTAAGLVLLDFEPDQSARFTAYSGAEIILQFDGAWREAPGAVIISYRQCQEGRPLRLKACDQADTLQTAGLAGDTWPIGIVDSGAVTHYHFRRVQ